MTTKKSLYRPAPELMEQSVANLVQGSSSKTKAVKVKQGVLGSSRKTFPVGGNRMTSTMKPAKGLATERRDPVVVCHNPNIVHSDIKSMGAFGDITVNASTSPTVVVFDQESKDRNAVKRTGKKVYHVESKYRANLLSVNKSTVNSSQHSFNTSVRLPREKPQKTSTPSVKQRREWTFNESAIIKDNSDPECLTSTEKHSMEMSHPPADQGDGDDIEILHCRYLQAKHLELTAKDNQRKKSEQAASQLAFLHNKNIQVQQELEELEDEVSELEYMHSLKSQLQQQKSGLAPVVEKLQDAIGQYQLLCKNLDTTRHHMPLADISDPDDRDMEKALDESQNLIGQINILTKSKESQIHHAAEATEKLSHTCKNEATNIPQAKNRTAYMISLLTEFGSLVAQLSSGKSE